MRWLFHARGQHLDIHQLGTTAELDSQLEAL